MLDDERLSLVVDNMKMPIGALMSGVQSVVLEAGRVGRSSFKRQTVDGEKVASYNKLC